MNKHLLVLLVSILSISFSNNLTLKDYLIEIKNNDPAYQQIFTNSQTIEGAIRSLSALYDPRISATIEYGNKEEQPYDVGGTTISLEDNNTLATSLGINKTFEDTGTNLNLSYLRVANSSKYITTNISQINPALTLKITQPLWKNFMGFYSRIPKKRMEIQKEIIDLSIKEAEETYFLNAINLYYDWVSLTFAIEPLKLSYTNAQLFHQEILAKYRNDAALKSDLLQAQNAVLLYRNALNETLHAWNSLAANIYQKMGKPFTFVTNWKNLPKSPKIQENFCEEKPTSALPEIRIFSTIKNTLRQYELDLEKLERGKLPDLSLYGELSKYNNFNDSNNSYFNLDKTEYKAGIVFSTSLEKNDIKGETQSLHADIYNTEKELLKTKKTINTLYQTNLSNLLHLQKIELNTQKIADNSKEILEIETKRFSQGKTSLFSITDYRQKYTQHKIDHLNKIVAIAKLKASIASINDSLLDKIKELIED